MENEDWRERLSLDDIDLPRSSNAQIGFWQSGTQHFIRAEQPNAWVLLSPGALGGFERMIIFGESASGGYFIHDLDKGHTGSYEDWRVIVTQKLP